MAANFLSAGADLDTLFKARTSSPVAATNFLVAGVDVNQRYEPRGSTTKRADVGFLSAGVDLSNIFMDIAASVGPAATLQVGEYGRTNGAPAQITWANTGAFVRGTGTLISPNYTWLTAGNAADVEMLVTVTSGGFSSGTVGSWLNMATSRAYAITVATGFYGECNFNVQMRRASDGLILATANGCKLWCDRTS